MVGCGATGRSQSAPARGADLVLIGGDVRTMDLAHPRATAVAVTGGRIAAVGSDGDIRPWIGKATQVIELRGRTLTPGLVDAHAHLYELGRSLESVDLSAAASADDAVRIAGNAAKTRPANAWVEGRGWDQTRWPGQQFPTAAALDAIDHPVLLERVDGHALWINTRAMQLANITAATPDPAGGRIVRDDHGAPTGVLLDKASDLVFSRLPRATPEERERRIRAAADLAVAAGLTGVHEMDIEDATAAVYQQLAERGQLPLRVYAFLHGDVAHLDRLATPPGPRHGNFQMRGVKFFADGALGSRGARLYADYADAPGSRGLWVTDPDALARGVDAAVAHGWQVAIHAIGDAAIGAVLDAYLAAEAKHPGEHRLRVEHLQVLAPDDLPRLVKAHAIASMQPAHAISDMPWAEARVGKRRIAGAYAWRTVLDAGVPLAFGSDFPFGKLDPLVGLYAAVTRQDTSGNPADGWYPAQKMSLDEALAAYTRGAAYAEFAEASRGTIAVGHAADLTVFAHALAPTTMLLHESVMLTIVGGKIVYRRPPRPMASERSPIRGRVPDPSSP